MTETRYGAAMIIGNELELERYVDDEDTILPFYRIPLTGEFLAAWAVHRLRETGCRCKRLTAESSATVAKRATRADKDLVYYSADATEARLIRAGKACVLTLEFNKKEEEEDFIHFIADLICENQAQAKPV
jgi:hypothetical protein